VNATSHSATAATDWPDFFTGTPDDLRSLTDVPVVVPAFGEPVEIRALLERGTPKLYGSAEQVEP
jgi:hypothetical protein